MSLSKQEIEHFRQAYLGDVIAEELCDMALQSLPTAQVQGEGEPKAVAVVGPNKVLEWCPPYDRPPVGTNLYASPPTTIAWVEAVDQELVCSHLGVADIADDFTTAKKKLNQLIEWNVAVATDPAVNGGMKLMRQRAEAQLAGEQERATKAEKLWFEHSSERERLQRLVTDQGIRLMEVEDDIGWATKQQKITTLRDLLRDEYNRGHRLDSPWDCTESDCPGFKQPMRKSCGCYQDATKAHIAKVLKEINQ